MYELQVGRGGMYHHGKQEEKVSTYLPLQLLRVLSLTGHGIYRKFWGAKIDASKDANGNTTTNSITPIQEKATSPMTASAVRRDSIAIPANLSNSPEALKLDDHPELGNHVPHFICKILSRVC